MEHYKFPCKTGDKIRFDPECDEDGNVLYYKNGMVLSIKIFINECYLLPETIPPFLDKNYGSIHSLITVRCNDGYITCVNEQETIIKL